MTKQDRNKIAEVLCHCERHAHSDEARESVAVVALTFADDIARNHPNVDTNEFLNSAVPMHRAKVRRLRAA